MNAQEQTPETQIAYLTVKFIQHIQKKRARRTTLEGSTNANLRKIILDEDTENAYSSNEIRTWNKENLIRAIIDLEGINSEIERRALELQKLNVNSLFIEQIESFGV